MTESAAGPGLTGPAEGQTIDGDSLFVRLANFVKLPHTVFALPFALVGVVYASFATAVTPKHVVLVVVAFTAARFAAMGFNRIVDRTFDAVNPRTKERELPAGKLSLLQARTSVAVASIVFVSTAGLLNSLCLKLAPFALAWILGYSYSKRFTSWPHIWLGLSLAIAPAGGYLAVTGSWPEPWWTLPVLAVAVMTWVGGFDMFYALPDEEFDRQQGLKSAVVLLGKKWSILVAKTLHGATIGALLLFGWAAGFGAWYFAGVVLAALILAWEHQLVKPDDLSKLDAAFFTMNGVMSIIVFSGALVDRIV
ncbi:MAG: putative 4-hydroxybenzoate polyprenyltransferase [Gemmatimonadota bacterium]|nr:putative 4-hydroxybenzoate polyprenyltransferase [Gemmatimonadota bacterium]